MKFSNRFYPVGNFEKKRLWIVDFTASRPQTNERADHLQTIRNPMFGFCLISLKTFRRRKHLPQPMLA